MGNSVDIEWVDGPKDKEVKAIVDKYQYGHFNGMEDIYEYSNKIEGIEQVKFVRTHPKRSFDTVKTMVDKINAEWDMNIEIEEETIWGWKDIKGAHVTRSADVECQRKTGQWASDFVYRHLIGYYDYQTV